MKKVRPVIIALVGVVGAGKSTVAKELAKGLDAAVVESNAIRVELRKEGKTYDIVRGLVLSQAKEHLLKGKSVIIDADHIDASKRTQTNVLGKKTGAKVFYTRVVCDIEKNVSRIIGSNYDSGTNTIYGSPAVKARELFRRTPLHYSWSDAHGGTWKIKKLPVKICATIDTTDGKTWKETAAQVVKLVRK